MSGTTPGRAAYEAYRTRVTELRHQDAGADFASAAPQPWDRLSDTFHEGWKAAEVAAWEHAAPTVLASARSHARDNEKLRTDLDEAKADRDRYRATAEDLARQLVDTQNDARSAAVAADALNGSLRAQAHGLREQLEQARSRLTALTSRLFAAAATSSETSEVELRTAIEVRDIIADLEPELGASGTEQPREGS